MFQFPLVAALEKMMKKAIFLNASYFVYLTGRDKVFLLTAAFFFFFKYIFRILHGMGPTPSADLVGSILGVDGEDNDFQQQRSTLRKTVTSRNALHSKPQEESAAKEPPMQIVWRNVLIFIYLHAAALYGGYLCFTAAKPSTLAWCKFNYITYCLYKQLLINAPPHYSRCSILLVFVWRIRNYGRST